MAKFSKAEQDAFGTFLRSMPDTLRELDMALDGVVVELTQLEPSKADAHVATREAQAKAREVRQRLVTLVAHLWPDDVHAFIRS